jgi:hypothetical protein
MSNIELAAKSKTIEGINRNWDKVRSIAADIGQNKISLVNLGRVIGIQLQELAGRDQINFAFFNHHAADFPPSLNFEAAKKCVKLANNLAQPVKTIQEAERVEQMLLEATGTVDAPKRLEHHTSRDLPPATFFFSVFTDAREKITKKLAGASTWDDETRESVKAEVARAEKWLEQVKQQVF